MAFHPSFVLWYFLLPASWFSGGVPVWGSDSTNLDQAVNSIVAKDLERHVAVLSDDLFEGREAGSRGGLAAGNYLVKYFEQGGLKPMGSSGSFFQQFGPGYRNLLGLLEGSDPELKNEVIIVGAHYDHVGYGNRSNSYGPIGWVHNGADDNASGTAAVLELIEAFGKLSKRPARSILFVLWDGEEKGLLGSKHWIQRPTVDLDSIRLFVNADMIGYLRKDQLEVYGVRSAWGLRQLVSRQNHENLKLKFTWEMRENSDHFPFFQKRIPILFFHTGLHDHYHRPSDDAERVNHQGLQRVSRMMFHVLHSAAQAKPFTKFRDQAVRETPYQQTQFEKPAEPRSPRLGVTVGPEPGETPGLLVRRVRANSSALRAGLQVGDRITHVNDQPLQSDRQLLWHIWNAERHIDLRYVREGTSTPQSVTAELSGKPARVGVSWRQDAADRQAFLITRVLRGSAADRAGVRVGDRIYRVNEQQLESNQQLAERLSTFNGPIHLEIERQGRIQQITVQLKPQN